MSNARVAYIEEGDPQGPQALVEAKNKNIGNVIRQLVKDNAEGYITDFVELLGEMEK